MFKEWWEDKKGLDGKNGTDEDGTGTGKYLKSGGLVSFQY